jgi:hypothetical protein
MLVITPQIDPLLLPFLTANDERDEGMALARLTNEQVEPTVRPILGFRLQHYFRPAEINQRRADIEEVYHDVQLRLLKRLRALRQDPADRPITNLHNYVATMARNTCDEYLRRKYPLRRSLKDKLRHHLISHPEFVLWEDLEHGSLAGLATWRSLEGQSPAFAGPIGGEFYERLRTELQGIEEQFLDLSRIVKAIFEIVSAPLELDLLTALVARFRGIEDRPVESLDTGGCGSSIQADNDMAGLEAIVEQRQLLQLLWRDICHLPRRHRIALLLNLKNPSGINVIMLLPVTGVATFEQISQALEITPAEFEQIWVELPLDDLRIAAYLGASRQQVINLRKTARDRLLRSVRLRSRE